MKSIIPQREGRCFLCGKVAGGDPLDEHHVFGGANRKNSEKYGLKVYLHHNSCHIFGEKAVHKNKDTMRAIQKAVQKYAMEYYSWSEDDFRKIFYRSYL